MKTREAVRESRAMPVRLASFGGAVFFALVIVFSTLTSNSPSATDSGQEIFDWVTKHQGRMQLAAVVMGFAMSAALLWLSGLFRTLRKAEGGTPGLAVVALGGGVLAAASSVTGALVLGTAAVRIEDLGPTGAGVWWTMFLMSLGATLLGLLLVVGSTAAVSERAKLFPGWFRVASIALALTSVVGACAIGYDASGIQAVAGIDMLLDSVWIFLISYYLWRDPSLAEGPMS